jgi:hypothetical protein
VGQRRDGQRLIGLDRFLEIEIGNTRDCQCSLALALSETSITRSARASRTKRRAASRWSSAIVAAARPCAIRSAACQLDYVGCGNMKDARANNLQPLSCFCQTCRTPILVLVTLPSSSLSDTHR